MLGNQGLSPFWKSSLPVWLARCLPPSSHTVSWSQPGMSPWQQPGLGVRVSFYSMAFDKGEQRSREIEKIYSKPQRQGEGSWICSCLTQSTQNVFTLTHKQNKTDGALSSTFICTKSSALSHSTPHLKSQMSIKDHGPVVRVQEPCSVIPHALTGLGHSQASFKNAPLTGPSMLT